MLRGLLICLAFITATVTVTGAVAQECRDIRFDDNRYSVCEVDVTQSELRLFLNDQDGNLLGQFNAINRTLEGEGRQLAFAMNAGMYHRDRDPVGYYTENGVQAMRVIPNAGPGNFGMLPNGIFCISPGRADVIETLEFVERDPDCTYATQSGPMLVIDGALHPKFFPESTSRYVRNGVGTSADGKRAVFAISRNAVTFYDFGRLFRDELKMPNALYFDGNVSRLYAPELRRHDAGFPMGPIVGVVIASPE